MTTRALALTACFSAIVDGNEAASVLQRLGVSLRLIRYTGVGLFSLGKQVG